MEAPLHWTPWLQRGRNDTEVTQRAHQDVLVLIKPLLPGLTIAAATLEKSGFILYVPLYSSTQINTDHKRLHSYSECIGKES